MLSPAFPSTSLAFLGPVAAALLPALLPLLSYLTVLIFIAAFTLFERKTMGLFQRREGPDRVGLEGFGQPFADGLKLVLKETLLPRQTPAPSVFYLAPLLSLTLSLALWLLLPLSAAGALVSSPISLLLLLALSSLGSYGVIYSGWASNNKYALLGSLRAVAQFISYEIILSLLFLPFVAAVGSLNLWAVVTFQGSQGSFGYLAPLALIFAIAMLAETNRTPFDLPEAEAELVSGFNVEYSSLLFAFFFLAEYGSMGLMAALFVALFAGGWTAGVPAPAPLAGALAGAGETLAQCATFALRTLLLCLLFVFVRASLPRQRFDQLIALCWKYLFPLSLTLVLWSLALYSLASRWLRGSELLSLAGGGNSGNSGGGFPWGYVALGSLGLLTLALVYGGSRGTVEGIPKPYPGRDLFGFARHLEDHGLLEPSSSPHALILNPEQVESCVRLLSHRLGEQFYLPTAQVIAAEHTASGQAEVLIVRVRTMTVLPGEGPQILVDLLFRNAVTSRLSGAGRPSLLLTSLVEFINQGLAQPMVVAGLVALGTTLALACTLCYAWGDIQRTQRQKMRWRESCRHHLTLQAAGYLSPEEPGPLVPRDFLEEIRGQMIAEGALTPGEEPSAPLPAEPAAAPAAGPGRPVTEFLAALGQRPAATAAPEATSAPSTAPSAAPSAGQRSGDENGGGAPSPDRESFDIRPFLAHQAESLNLSNPSEGEMDALVAAQRRRGSYNDFYACCSELRQRRGLIALPSPEELTRQRELLQHRYRRAFTLEAVVRYLDAAANPEGLSHWLSEEELSP